MNGNSVKNIVELDKRARERVAEARRKAEQIDAEAKEKTKQLLQDYKDHSRLRLEMLEQSYMAQTDKKLSDIEANKLKKIAAFDKALSDNREALEEQIFNAVIGKERRH